MRFFCLFRRSPTINERERERQRTSILHHLACRSSLSRCPAACGQPLKCLRFLAKENAGEWENSTATAERARARARTKSRNRRSRRPQWRRRFARTFPLLLLFPIIVVCDDTVSEWRRIICALHRRVAGESVRRGDYSDGFFWIYRIYPRKAPEHLCSV